MQKIAVAIAHKEALHEAFVVFRGFEENIPMAADLGYNGIEMALRRANEIDPVKIEKLLVKNKMEVSAISTGQIFAESGLTLMEQDISGRKQLFDTFFGLIDLAADFGNKINIGRVRGSIDANNRAKCLELFKEGISKLCEYALIKNVDILLEPVNRYEINFINNLQEAGEIINTLNIPNLYMMPDLFHMNIEDKIIEDELVRFGNKINYIHFADSNRLAPGWGHTDFISIHKTLVDIHYTGWYSVEILPKPTAVDAARQAINFLNNL